MTVDSRIVPKPRPRPRCRRPIWLGVWYARTLASGGDGYEIRLNVTRLLCIPISSSCAETGREEGKTTPSRRNKNQSTNYYIGCRYLQPGISAPPALKLPSGLAPQPQAGRQCQLRAARAPLAGSVCFGAPNTLQRGQGHWPGSLSALDHRPANQSEMDVIMLDPRAADGTSIPLRRILLAGAPCRLTPTQHQLSGRRGLWSHATLLMLGT